jgi:hypothetical protein
MLLAGRLACGDRLASIEGLQVRRLRTAGELASVPYTRAMTEPQLSCPLCRGTEFQQETARQDSQWGFTSHRMTLMICRRCRYMLHFYDRHSIFDFD